MTRRVRWLPLAAVTGASLLTACDRDDNVPPVARPAPAATATTRSASPADALLHGPRAPMPLRYAPLTLIVPKGWTVQSYDEGATVLIEGATPTDVARISILPRRLISPDQITALGTANEQDRAARPDRVRVADVRDAGPARVFESAIVDPPVPPAAPQGVAALAPPMPRTVQWTFTACVPQENRTVAYELRFLGLTLDQYEADRAFLSTIMRTLAYDPSALARVDDGHH